MVVPPEKVAVDFQGTTAAATAVGRCCLVVWMNGASKPPSCQAGGGHVNWKTQAFLTRPHRVGGNGLNRSV